MASHTLHAWVTAAYLHKNLWSRLLLKLACLLSGGPRLNLWAGSEGRSIGRGEVCSFRWLNSESAISKKTFYGWAGYTLPKNLCELPVWSKAWGLSVKMKEGESSNSADTSSGLPLQKLHHLLSRFTKNGLRICYVKSSPNQGLQVWKGQIACFLKAHSPLGRHTYTCDSKSGQPGIGAEITSPWNLSMAFLVGLWLLIWTSIAHCICGKECPSPTNIQSALLSCFLKILFLFFCIYLCLERGEEEGVILFLF